MNNNIPEEFKCKYEEELRLYNIEVIDLDTLISYVDPIDVLPEYIKNKLFFAANYEWILRHIISPKLSEEYEDEY